MANARVPEQRQHFGTGQARNVMLARTNGSQLVTTQAVNYCRPESMWYTLAQRIPESSGSRNRISTLWHNATQHTQKVGDMQLGAAITLSARQRSYHKNNAVGKHCMEHLMDSEDSTRTAQNFYNPASK